MKENPKNIEIEVVQLSPDNKETFKNREFRLISSDSVFLSTIVNNDKKYYNDLFYKYWETEKDWFINSILFNKFEVNAIEMVPFVPNEISEWRNQKKAENYIFWDSLFSTMKTDSMQP